MLCVRSTAQQGGRLSQLYNTLQCAAVMHESDADLNQKQHLMHNVAGSITIAKMSPDSRLSHVLIVNLLSSEDLPVLVFFGKCQLSYTVLVCVHSSRLKDTETSCCHDEVDFRQFA